MAPDVTPEGLRQARFRTTFRGVDPAEVEALLHSAATRIAQLETEREKLEKRLQELPPAPDLENEFQSIGQEVTTILQAAREAAESMRERASLDAARWRSEAMAEADSTRKEAAADAEALRRDAWVTGSELLQQASAAAEAMRGHAERDVLTVMGEAEREAHRLTSSARREAEDLIRNTTMEAEKTVADAAKRRDEIIDSANRQAATAQERTRALEQRRDELLEELENVRSTLTRLEGSLEERREALELTASEPSSVRVVHPPADAKRQWELGETVRVIPPADRNQPSQDALRDELSADVESRDVAPEPPAEESVAVESEPMPEPSPPPVDEAGSDEQAEAETPSEQEPAPEPEPERDDLAHLFAALRGGGESEPEEPGGQEVAEPPKPRRDRDAEDGVDWIEVRESRLLPITNRALRGVKKAMSDVQNVALDRIRTDETWRPDEDSIADALHAEIVAVWSESFAAGHAVAEQMAGSKLKRPPTPSSAADRKFATDLASAVGDALQRAGGGPRERQSAASRVFRVWRSDEAERRIRDLALTGYESGIEESRKVGSSAPLS